MKTQWTRRVLYVEDQQAMRVLTAAVFESAGFAVMSASSAHAALDMLEEWDPDVLVTDIELGSRPDGVELAHIARRLAPHLGIVFVTSFPRAAHPQGQDAILGAVHLDKTQITSPDDLVAALEQALRAREDQPMAATVPADLPAGIGALTEHQRRVLSLIAAGLSNTEIAARTDASVRAVERTVARVFDTLGVSRVSAVNPRVVAANEYNRLFGPLVPT
ncbi:MULTISPECIES: response regulator transcription factor [unclassified Leucobacter]|uniref:response regulator transcription factor n=1 Tax=unclassified Leucobacter TaxID=2621730 RepID=UPI00165E9A5D|nr:MULTISPECIES: response regulator transcription factor [unclassified Leucobacter]MBC9926778.1 response regulator transcription factor [Leucobacter sp. cx-169]